MKESYGQSVPDGTGADGNGSGSVETEDYVVWRTYWNSPDQWTVGAWDLSTFTHGFVMEVVDSATAPKVLNVTISGSSSTHDPYSFATHVGSGEQLQTVPVGGADTISITFDQEVNIEASYLRVVGLRTANVPGLAEFTYDAATMTATWRFENLNPYDAYAISLSDAVTNLEGYRLDGEWVNPATRSTTNSQDFPSGDGHAGGNFNFVFTLLAGDANLDLTVSYSDYYLWSSHYGQSGGFQIGDFNGNGTVGSDDITLFYSNLGKNLQSVWILGDVNGDLVVNDEDLDVLIANYGLSNRTYAQGDLNGDGQVNMTDMDLALAQYGTEVSVVS